MLILVQQFIEMALYVWKILKTTKFELRQDRKFPFIKTKHQESYRSTTEEFDKMAARYLYMALIPLFCGYLVMRGCFL
jgi:hypothetical protein